MTEILAEFEQKTTRIAYFDPSGVFPDLKDDLLSKLPLVNLHWNPPGRPLRSIPSLDVELVEEQPHADALPQHQILGLSDAPYLKLIFVKCDDNDTYRGSVRKMIRDWLSKNVVGVRDPTEWLVVHYVPPGSKSYSGNRFKQGVFDKIKADFNSGSKRDRCLQIRKDMASSDVDHMETWSDAMTRVKEGVLDAFSRRVDLYQAEITKLEAKKNVMGWNFGTFFVMKEGLALSFENVNLFEDALLLYDELEAAFARMSSSSLFFSTMGFDTSAPTPTSLLKLRDDKEMRHQVMANAISLFDFHCYLFSRQASLLLYISKASSAASISALKVGEMYARLRTFITQMNALLISNKKSPLRVAEWSYNIVQEFLKATESVQDGLAREVSEGRGEILLMCRKALETLAAGLNKWYIEGALSEVSLMDDEEASTGYVVENEHLKDAVKDKESFYDKYRALTEDASGQFLLADRVRTVDRLSTQLAMLDYQLENYQAAAKALESLPDLYNRQGWDLISTSLLSVYVKSLEKLNRKEDILIFSLELLRRYKYLSEPEIAHLVDNVEALCAIKVVVNPLDDWFTLTTGTPHISTMHGSHGVYTIKCTLTSQAITRDFAFEYATMTLVSSSAPEKVTFRCENPISSSELTFITNRFIQGEFEVDSVTFIKGKLSFVKNNMDTRLHLFPSPDYLWGNLRLASSFTLVRRKLTLNVYIPGFDLDVLKVRFKPAVPGLKLSPANSTAEVDGIQISTEFSSPSLSVKSGILAGNSVRVHVPFTADYELTIVAIKVTMDYTTEQGTFQHSFTQEVDVSLAIDVNVEDYFKASRLFSRFSVSCKDKLQPVRIDSVKLSSSIGYEVTSPIGANLSIIAFPGNPVSYSFAIDRKGEPNRDALTLSIRHRLLRNGMLARPTDFDIGKLT
jgi:hypothetical protein